MKLNVSKTAILSVIASEILNSRGNPTIETKVTLSNGIISKASVPSGASTGKYEQMELQDKDPKRYHGKGVMKAVDNVNKIIAKKIKNARIESMQTFDSLMIDMDGTENKSRLGANAILSVSMALARALAANENIPLYKYIRNSFFPALQGWGMPRCMMNIVNGGIHSNWTTDIQEYIIIPNNALAREQIRCGSEIFHSLENILKKSGLPTTVGDEGGFAPKAKSNKQPLDWIIKAISDAGYDSSDVSIALDVASSGWYKEKFYEMNIENEKKSSDKMIEFYENLIREYPIVSIEDGLAEDDWEGWKKMTAMIGKKIHLIGDDIFVTNIKRISRGIKEKSANGVLIKLNQIGTVSETIRAIQLAKENNYAVAISHRSAETSDDFISDLAVASGAEFLKAGSLSRGERIAKYNRLMEIENEISNGS